MVLSDRLLHALAAYLQKEVELGCPVRLRDWDGLKGKLELILDLEDSQEDPEMRGNFQVAVMVQLSVDSGVSQIERQAYLREIENALCSDSALGNESLLDFLNDGGPEREIEGGLQVFDVWGGFGEWELGERIVGTIELDMMVNGQDRC